VILTPATIFRSAAEHWLADGGSLEVTFLASEAGGIVTILDASLSFVPVPVTRDVDFIVKFGSLLAGRKTVPSISRATALGFVEEAIAGRVQLQKLKLTLGGSESYDLYSEIPHRDRASHELHLQVSGQPSGSAVVNPGLDDHLLRTATPPFDGMVDLLQTLSLSDTRSTLRRPAITLRVQPSVEVALHTATLTSNRLNLDFLAAARADRSKIHVAIRVFPGSGLNARQQVGDKIEWKRAVGGVRAGSLTLALEKADAVLVMLSYEGFTVRRGWVVDPEKATNPRTMAMQSCDKDLKQLRHSLLDSTDSARFEQAVASLFFLLGFSSGPVLETQAPDVLLATPNGAIVLVECTMRISDFAAKAGKLVDRRHNLISRFQASGQSLRVEAILVSSQPRGQVAAEEARIAEFNIALLTKEDISTALSQVLLPNNADKALDEFLNRRSSPHGASLG
jgi:hypothetical protein